MRALMIVSRLEVRDQRLAVRLVLRSDKLFYVVGL